jgi:hypothetical protein
MFADISGFTSWSSVSHAKCLHSLRPFIMDSIKLLERGVFKVKPLGTVMWPFLDCQEKHKVCKCGTRSAGIDCCNSQYSHALSLFSHACLPGSCSGDVQICPRLFGRMKVLVHKLEVTLGPDTADLTIRVGLHSGRLQPVCCVSALQLFGDTMNTAARIETSGLRDKIHISLKDGQPPHRSR